MLTSHFLICCLMSPAVILKEGYAFPRRAIHYSFYHLFAEISHRKYCSLGTRLAHAVCNRDFNVTWALFCDMHHGGSNIDAYTFSRVITACSAFPGSKCGKQVHGLMIKTGTELGTITKTALLDMYSKYGYLDDSVKVFEEIKFKDVVAWNALLSGFLRHGLAKEALGVFRAMRREAVEYNEFTLCSLLKACANLRYFRLGKQVHGLVIVMGRDLVVLHTALIDFYSDIGYIFEAMKVFSSLNCGRDDVMLNSLISGCIQNRNYKEAFSIMCKMRPNVIALTSALAACSDNSNLWIGKQIHCVAIRFGLVSDTQICNVLLDMYAKCGKIFNAWSVFDRIFPKDVISWTTMINAYGSHGHGLYAFELFKKMGEGKSGVSPNSVTILAVLSACGHSGLVEEGWECFNMAQEKHGLDLGPEHYACFIDILGRAGRIEDAWRLFNSMVDGGNRPTTAVWAALVNACTLNLDVSRGELAAKHLFELEPDKPENFVLLSNFYAASGKWNCVDELRGIMRERGMVKEAGSSWVTTEVCHQNAVNLSV